MDRERVTEWVAAYERAWRTPGTDPLATIFTADASYLQGPYRQPVLGLPAIARMWEAEREGPDEAFRMTSEVVAVDGDTAVVRAEVHYGEPTNQEFRDLWILRFADDGRCRAFEEWPFWPPNAGNTSQE
ncbi:YybH family protein [Micromonospora sp. NBC_01796]|uniref:YybH family protein n=1 Tax=Micromonospora sp. NBC_01796 TaxID=2975987 RepID=UPI002DDB241A|nr:nuclear transport factor 2 family protein [Micromonospora sp. NBC_01796]WSA85670.1 nuclear transport factor 2 family protein [Micromonospora sp. NBC_01796]